MKLAERRGVSECAKKIDKKKDEEIIQREPTSLPTGRSAYMYCKVKSSEMIKLGKREYKRRNY